MKNFTLLTLITLIAVILPACTDKDITSIERTNATQSIAKTKTVSESQTDNQQQVQEQMNSNSLTSQVSTEKHHDKGVNQAKSFANIYSTTCMKYLNNMDGLRAKLKGLPTLPPEKAQNFLNGMQGDVYPVPDTHGFFILVLAKDTNMCAVYAKKADTQVVLEQFKSTFSTAPTPLHVIEKSKSVGSPMKKITSYEWYQQGASQKMLFMLSTDSSEDATVQAMFTASIISDGG